MQVEGARFKRLHAAWLHLYDILKKTELLETETDTLPEAGDVREVDFKGACGLVFGSGIYLLGGASPINVNSNNEFTIGSDAYKFDGEFVIKTDTSKVFLWKLLRDVYLSEVK